MCVEVGERSFLYEHIYANVEEITSSQVLLEKQI